MPILNAATLKPTLEAFTKLVDTPDVTEGDVQAFMEDHSELIPTPLMLGHDLHFRSIISKFNVNAPRIPDLVYLTKNTGYWRLVLVELERPQKQLFTKAARGQFHSDTNAAIDQIEDWKLRVNTHLPSIRESLIPITYPSKFRTHPMEVEYVLIIGRNPVGKFTPERSGRIHTLQKERHITLITYDSIIRMAHVGNNNIGRPKNILSHYRDKFRVKHANVRDTIMFGYLSPDDIELSQEQIEWYKSLGYDMDSWLKYKPLAINGKSTSFGNAMDEMLAPKPLPGTSQKGTP
jgi:hypothetical protein